MQVQLSNSGPSDYSPAHLLNEIGRYLELTNDTQLALRLKVNGALLSRVRHGQSPVSGSLLICMHEATGLPIAQLRHILGDRRKHFRMAKGRRQAALLEASICIY